MTDAVRNEPVSEGSPDTGHRRMPHLISGLQQPETAARLSKEQLGSLIEYHHAVMLLVDPDSGVIMDANRAASKFYGYTVTELRGKKITDISPSPAAQIEADLRRAKADGLNYFIALNKLSNNELRTAEIHASPIAWGDRILLFSIVHDITEHKRCEEELKTTIARLEEVNTAMKVILQQTEKSREELNVAIVSNIGELILPSLDKLKKSPLSPHQFSIVQSIESNLLDISSSFLKKLKTIHHKLTAREIEIAALVKEGKSTKEISERVNVSTKTIEFHRNRLREKLGLKRKKVNLRSHLLTIK